MPGTEAEHEAPNGDGRVAARAPGDVASAGGGREPAEAAAAAPPDADPAAAASPRDASAGPGVPAEPPVDDSAGSGAEEVAAAAGISDQEFGLAVDVIYHRARAAWFALEHRVFLFGTIMAGSAAAADVYSAKGCALVAAALGTLDLVLDPTGRMVEHRDLSRDTLAIVADLHRNDFSAEASRRAVEEEFRLSANETAPFNALRTMAFNQAVTAFGKPESMRVWVPWERRWLANLIRFEGWRDANPQRLEWLKRRFRRPAAART